ncbi:hypothetical protein J1605_007392 [Eschrichtius robustus]|uniref:Uncharacterized protein n=1 Tax=Eschrichtius robustus TaxID=9764 RepID=A0AB34GXQ9_ESCRO|nr:hypothetical protein J1605_007392 [Eschrichtius robustus]
MRQSASVPCSVAPEKPVWRPQPPQVRRTFSLDTILSSYLLGQWPRDADGAFTCCTNDKATQKKEAVEEFARDISRTGGNLNVAAFTSFSPPTCECSIFPEEEKQASTP